MIAIVDNGGDYEEHHVLFVDLGDWTPEELHDAVAAFGGGASVLGWTESIQWRGDRECDSVAEALHALGQVYDEGSADLVAERLPLHLRQRVLRVLEDANPSCAHYLEGAFKRAPRRGRRP